MTKRIFLTDAFMPLLGVIVMATKVNKDGEKKLYTLAGQRKQEGEGITAGQSDKRGGWKSKDSVLRR